MSSLSKISAIHEPASYRRPFNGSTAAADATTDFQVRTIIL